MFSLCLCLFFIVKNINVQISDLKAEIKVLKQNNNTLVQKDKELRKDIDMILLDLYYKEEDQESIEDL